MALSHLVPVAAQVPTPAREPSAEAYCRLAEETEANFRRHVLDAWYPRAVDNETGGFRQNFGADWSPGPDTSRGIVYQSRLTWVAARASLHDRARSDDHAATARHGLKFLADRMWDKEHGGFFWAVNPQGQPTTDRGGEKHAYGVAFGIYAAATCYTATRDPAALDLATRAFAWLDRHAHDAINGGYYEALARDGSPLLAPPTTGGATADVIGTRYGLKSMNTHIHVLEALTALHEAAPDDATVRARLQEVFDVVLGRIVVESVGCQNLYFTPDWRPIPGENSFGHDVETAYLLVEASTALGRPDDARTWAAARRLVDHALDFGWDATHGGFYDHGKPFGPPSDTGKIWWVQAEGLNALLLMHEKFGRESGRYWDAFDRQWAFIRDRQVDTVRGGWYPRVDADGKLPASHVKSDGWTEGYHQGRALVNVTESLRRLAAR